MTYLGYKVDVKEGGKRGRKFVATVRNVIPADDGIHDMSFHAMSKEVAVNGAKSWLDEMFKRGNIEVRDG